jgi:hypothetical protein
MEYCDECDRYFQSAESLQQHLGDSARHRNRSTFVYGFGSTTVTTLTPPVRASPQISASGFEMASGRISWRDREAQRATACGTGGTAGDDTNHTIDTSKILIDSLKGLYISGEYSDLVISCRGKEYHVHRAVVCTQSDFFSAACRGAFKEAQEGKIDLPDDDPRLVDIMVHYLYHFDYDVQSHGLETDRHRTNDSEPGGGALLTHAKVYSLAEKYLIHGLKAVALRQFKAATDRSPDVNDFLPAMEEVYTSTMEDDRGLRDVVVETLYVHSEWLDEEDVRDVVQGLGALTYDMVIYLRKERIF